MVNIYLHIASSFLCSSTFSFVSERKKYIEFCETAPKNHNTQLLKREHQFIFISTDKQVLTFRETSKSIKRDLQFILINFHESIPLTELFFFIDYAYMTLHEFVNFKQTHNSRSVQLRKIIDENKSPLKIN